MYTIYHNPRCKKSREGLVFLQQQVDASQIDIKLYLKEPTLTVELIQYLQDQLLDEDKMNLVRQTEKIWKENYKEKDLTNKEVLKAIVENPQLLQRPIISNGTSSVIARPKEEILKLI